MEAWLQTIITVIGTVIASSGFWAYMQSRDKKKSAERQILLGLSHDAIIQQCDKYMKRGYIYDDEYKDLIDYLYTPYSELGGNGSAERAVNLIKQKLEMRTRR